MITTTKTSKENPTGLMDETLLEKKEGFEEDDRQKLHWIEYWLDGELVHRSVHMQLKQGVEMFPIAASIEG